MTKEDWEQVDKALSGIYGRVELQVDGRKVSFCRTLVGKNRLSIVTYVDEKIHGEAWLQKNNHPDSRYWQPKSRYLWKPASRREMKKMGKRRLQTLGYDPDEKQHYFEPFWPNATAIRRHYQKTFESIELVEVVG